MSAFYAVFNKQYPFFFHDAVVIVKKFPGRMERILGFEPESPSTINVSLITPVTLDLSESSNL